MLDDRFSVKYINSEIVVAMRNGKLSILDGSLESKREFDAEPDARASDCEYISGNEKFIAVGYNDGTVRYWNKSGDKEPAVI